MFVNCDCIYFKLEYIEVYVFFDLMIKKNYNESNIILFLNSDVILFILI